MELAVVVDLGARFVKATYALEVDGPQVLIEFWKAERLQAVIQEAFPGNLPLQNQAITYAKACVQPGIKYFHAILGEDDSVMKGFKAARLFSPHRLNEIQPSAQDIDNLRAFPFMDNEVNSLQTELPTYLSLSADVSAGIDTLNWWKDHYEELPCWSSAGQKVFFGAAFFSSRRTGILFT